MERAEEEIVSGVDTIEDRALELKEKFGNQTISKEELKELREIALQLKAMRKNIEQQRKAA